MATKSQNGVVDAPDITIADDMFLSWGDTGPKRVRKYIPKYKKWIEFLDTIPIDRLASLQSQFMQGETKDQLGFQMAVLKEVMIIPALQTDESRRAAMHADGALISMIITQVITIKDADTDQDESLGNA